MYEKGYQDFELVESAATTKLKGVIYPNSTSLGVSIPGITDRIWDVADYVVPPQVKILNTSDTHFRGNFQGAKLSGF